MTFKPGDRVECVGADGCACIIAGREYVVEEAAPTSVRVGGVAAWHPTRCFRLVDPEPAPDAPQPGLIYTVGVHEPPTVGTAVLWRVDDEDTWMEAVAYDGLHWQPGWQWTPWTPPTEHAPAPPDLVPVLLPRDVVEWGASGRKMRAEPDDPYRSLTDACRAALDAEAKP